MTGLKHDKIKPLVSVVICTYNGEKYLRQQIDSILVQTYANLELIISDDASTDSTAAILEEYRLKDQRVKYVINQHNIGYNKNFEKAFSLAAAEFIAISDQDDVWKSNKIETMMNEWPDRCSFVYSLSGIFYDNDLNSKQPAPPVYYSDITDLHQLVFNSPVHGHACMFKKELVKHCVPFPADIFYDWWMSMHAASRGFIGCIPQTLTWHRVHAANSSRSLVSIKDKDERNRQLRKQCSYFIEAFFQALPGETVQRKSLLKYASLLKKMDGKNFLGSMFWYVLEKRKLIFHYKKKPFVFFSHLKHAFRMARKGLL